MKSVALVTGASGALGSAIAHRLAQAGCAVAVHYGQREKQARALAAAIEVDGGVAAAFGADVRAPDEVALMVSEIERSLGPLAIVVNNAGLVRDRTLAKMSDEDWDVVVDTNLKGAFNVCRSVAEGMRARRHGRIVNVSSIVGAMGNYGQANYAASKAGLIGLTKALAREMARHNITVNAICPGFMDSPMVSGVPQEVQQKLLEQIPLRRFGEPEAVAEGVAYLVGPGGAYVTGQVLHINGGMYM
ncbi:MAG TPA: 3-oxoacyl-[acyl-carrier-protein] reductase [Myxococcales bacterium]|nr:3-oxoacyl-[acyl-carrier-protein] reductase [Myxococcales bacterium]